MYDDDILKEFLVESYENLEELDREFVALEAEPESKERLSAIFRTVHTIKGGSGFLGLKRLEALTHAGEALLSRLRDGELSLTPEMTSALLTLVDRVRSILGSVERGQGEGDTAHEDIVARLHALNRGEEVPEEPDAQDPPEEPEEPSEAEAPAPNEEAEKPATAPAADVSAAPAPAPSKAAPAPSKAPEPTAESKSQPSLAESSVRVDVGLLDKLMNMVGELVLTRNQIVQIAQSVNDTEVIGASQRLNLITTELQQNVMKTRMQPIGSLWSKLPRVVRDLSVSCGKQVRVQMHGKSTELDRTILEAIKAPLTHIVRNSVDHGIETPDVRVAAGKPKTGNLILKAYHEGGQVNIEISDDGAGINVQAVRKKAIERGVVTEAQANALSDRELSQLVFQPGFSTAKEVTNVSGRGVGMDVVKTNIERVGGTVDLVSTGQTGTTLKVKIPLTLAIVPALIVASGGDRFAIPQVNLVELVRHNGGQNGSVETVMGQPVYRLRGRLLPLVFLDRSLGLDSRTDDSGFNIVVLQAGDEQFGLVVDEVHDSEEIVVKPLGAGLKDLACFAGATVMGDGRVAIILDVIGLAHHAGVMGAERENDIDNIRDAMSEATAGEQKNLLLFRVGSDRMAIPLDTVSRLEEFPRERLESAGPRDVVQYRSEILELINLEAVLGSSSDDVSPTVPVIVYTDGDRTIGFAVSRILDVVEHGESISTDIARPCVLGATVVDGSVVEILDVDGVLSNTAEDNLKAERAA